MNSKAIKRQLLAAIAMVLVAALALGSSTYAWFVASGSVTAKGMKVNVQSSGGLVISYAGDQDAWGVTASGGITDARTLTPVSTADMTDWSTAQAEVANLSKFNKNTIVNVKDNVLPNGTYSDTNKYAVMRAFKIRSASPSQLCKGLYVEDITVTGANNTLDTSLRVGFRYKYSTDGSTYITQETTESGTKPFAFITGPVVINGGGDGNEATSSYKFYTSKDTSDANAAPVNLREVGTSARIVPANIDITNGISAPVVVEIYIWYEGQDNNLFSDNVKAIDDLDITVTFTSDSMASSDSKVDLTSAEAVDTGTKTIGSVIYYPITGQTFNGKQLYATAKGSINSASMIYTLNDENNPTVATNVNAACTLPST